MEELQEKVNLVLEEIKGATKMISGWSKSRTEDEITKFRRTYIHGYQEQISVLCQATMELPPLTRGYILVTTNLTEVIRGFEDAIARYCPELLKEED